MRSGKERDGRCICRALMGGLLILSAVVGLIERFFPRLVAVIEVCVCSSSVCVCWMNINARKVDGII